MKNTAIKNNDIKNKFKKQRRKIFSIMAVGLLVLSLGISSVFASLIHTKNQEILYNQTAARFGVSLRPNLTKNNVQEVADYAINKNHLEENSVQVIVKHKDTGELYLKTRNCLPKSSFSWELKDNNNGAGFIEYDNFRTSMTDEQYKKISDYLLTELEAESENDYLRYDLFCSEFYLQGTEIIPKKVEILKVSNYTETPVESFELNPKHNKSTKLYKTENILRNYIQTDFVLGKYEKEDLMSKIEGLKPTEFYENFNGAPIYYTDTFEFVLCHTEDVEITAPDGNSFWVTATYLEKVNTLDGSLGEILAMCAFIIYIVAVTGIVICAVLWKAVKKQLEEAELINTVNK